MKQAFTLAEVLITIAVVGVVASMTIPTVYNNVSVAQRNAQLKTVYTDFSQAYALAQQDLGYYPKCGYWGKTKNPYPHYCAEYTAAGECKKYLLTNGQEFPKGVDVNGQFSDCKAYGAAIMNRLNASSVCTSSAKNCLGYTYEGIDDALRSRTDLTDYDVTKSTTGVGGMRTSAINSSYYIKTAKGPIIVGYKGIGTNYFHPRYFAIDINGTKGPNRFGYDVHAFSSQYEADGKTIDIFPAGNYYASGGQTVSNILNGKTKDHKLNRK